MDKKRLIEICLNLNDDFSGKWDELTTEWLIVLESFIVEWKDRPRFVSHNLPLVLKKILEDSQWLYSKWTTSDKITKKDFILRSQELSAINFIFLWSKNLNLD